MASPESLRKGISSQKVQKENTPVVQGALSFVSVMGTKLKTSKDVENPVAENNHEAKYTYMIELVDSEQVSHNILFNIYIYIYIYI